MTFHDEAESRKTGKIHKGPDMKQERIGNWLQTASGRQFWPLDPRPEDIDIEDIAHALSNICRYNGHCSKFYSVAQHSVLVSHALPPELALWGLLHDASEAYICDIPRPTKPYLTNYAEIEARIMTAVAQRFQLPAEMPAEVKRVDAAILADEMKVLMKPPSQPWFLPEPPLGIEITPWFPKEAYNTFMSYFEDLTDTR